MKTSVKIMNTEVAMISKGTLLQQINTYLEDEEFQVILFASASLLHLGEEDELLRSELERVHLLLPGEEAVLALHHLDVLQAGNMVVSCKVFGDILESICRQKATVYIISDNRERIGLLQDFIGDAQPRLQIVGVSVLEAEVQTATVLNDINSETPDVLFLDLEETGQIQWLKENKDMLNAKLCIAIGGVSTVILDNYHKVPEWVQGCRIEKLYRLLFFGKPWKNRKKERIFRKK